MSSTSLSQDPLLVWPSALLNQSQRFLQNANTTRNVVVSSFEDERKNDIAALIKAMKRDYPDMKRAIAWYESLLNPGECDEEYTQLSFLRNINDDGFDVHSFQLGARPPPLEPHVLKVVFHRRPLWVVEALNIWGCKKNRLFNSYIKLPLLSLTSDGLVRITAY